MDCYSVDHIVCYITLVHLLLSEIVIIEHVVNLTIFSRQKFI